MIHFLWYCSQRHTVQSRHDTSFLNSLFYLESSLYGLTIIIIELRIYLHVFSGSLFSRFSSLCQYVYLKGQYDNNNTKNCLQKYMNICENKKITIVAENKPAKIVTNRSIRENTTLLNIFILVNSHKFL